MMSKMIMFTSMILMTVKHPLSMGSILMIQTIMVSNKMSMDSNSSWFSYILFITIIGGMMVMFMYMSSIASNEKFKLNMKQTIMITMMIILMIMMMSDSSMEYLNKMTEKKKMIMQKEEVKITTKFFNLNKMNVTILMMMILLLTMVIVTNMSSTFEGPLKKTYV
uniref:NADH dehydrogenase subunit 6 n=1 Tax=Pochazia confusa TaxID=1308480 RepID=UPI001EE00A64|nr:NADH dehydrogenase subunit 6 [Pochazia confusa]UJT96872.1 NADH dehydrogenase subunit 6 [Pochazia confusa]